MPDRKTSVAQTNIQLYRQLIDAGWDDDALGRIDAAYRFVMPLCATRFRANGKPFLAHLVGVASLLAQHGAAPALVIAGLVHAAFAQGDFAGEPVGESGGKHRALAAVAGDDVAGLVAAYDRFPWSSRSVAALAARADRLSAEERALVTLRLANEIEDHLDGAAGFSGKTRYDDADFLASVQVLAIGIGAPELGQRLAREVAETVPVPAILRRDDRLSFTLGAPMWVPSLPVRVLRRLGWA